MGNSRKINGIELFNKAGIIGKTITLTKLGKRTEDMKLFRIDFDDIMNKLEDIIHLKNDGTPIINNNGVVRSAPNFPKSSDNLVFVRGSGRDSTSKTLKINGINMYQELIWIKGSYIAKLLSQ